MAKRGRQANGNKNAATADSPVISQPEYVSPFDQILLSDGFQQAQKIPSGRITLWGVERGPEPGTCFLHRMVLVAGLVVDHKIRTWDIRAIQIAKASGYMEGEEL